MADETTTEMLAEIEGQAAEPQPVQVCEGRWRTRGGEVKNIKPCENVLRGANYVWPWTDGFMTFQDNGLHQGSKESPRDLVQYLGPIEQPEKIITPDDVAGEALGGVWNQVQAERTIEDLQHRLDVVSAEWAEQAATINGLQQQLEAVKAELMRVSHDRYQLQIELDAAQQVPQAVSDRFEEGWDAGTARAVETIAEWTEPFRRCGSERLAWMVMQNLPHIMRSLNGLTEED